MNDIVHTVGLFFVIVNAAQIASGDDMFGNMVMLAIGLVMMDWANQ